MNTIYLVENIKNKKLYIGITNRNLTDRYKQHIHDAKKKEYNMPLHKAIRKYDKDSFKFHSLEKIENRDKAFKAEKKWIKLFNTYKGQHGYNATPGGNGASSGKDHHMYGVTGEDHHNYGKSWNLDKKTRRKMSEAHKNTSRSEEFIEKISKANRGENAPRSKLTKEEAAEIKWLAQEGNMAQKEIANKYGISATSVSSIKTEGNWSHIDSKNPNK